MVRVFVVVHFLSWFKYSRMKINHIWASQVHFVKSDMVVTLKFWPLKEFIRLLAKNIISQMQYLHIYTYKT